LADISPSTLIQGHGEKVCFFLNTLADTALKQQNYRWKEFIYPKDTSNVTLDQQQVESENEEVLDEVPNPRSLSFILHRH
jgi:hypothetical protein